MFFDIPHPQLEKDPFKTPLGVKRYVYRKNEVSPNMLISFPDIKHRSRSSTFNNAPHLSSRSREDYAFQRLREEVRNLDKDFGKKPTAIFNSFASPRVRPSPEPQYSRPVPSCGDFYHAYASLPKYNTLQDHTYTKMNPRVLCSSIITGYSLPGRPF